MYNLSNEDKKWVDGVWDKIDAKMKTVAKKNINKIPYTTDENGDFDDCATGKWHMICHGGQTVFGRDICGFYM